MTIKLLFFIFAIFLVIPFSTYAQEIIPKQDAAAVDEQAQSLEVMLKSLAEGIGDARIVLLGEQSHSDGATFTARFEMIKFLHEKMGFDLLVFESGFYDMDKADRLRKNGTDIHEIFNHSIFSEGSLMGLWLETSEFSRLIQYLMENPELEIAGFDCQISSNLALEKLLPEFVSFLEANNHRLKTSEIDLIEEALYELEGGDFKNFLSEQDAFNQFIALFDELEKKVSEIQARQPSNEKSSFWLQWIKSFRGTVGYSRAEGQGVKFIAQNPRDSLMADNLDFIIEQNPNKKIIGIGASYHFARNLHLIDFDNKITIKEIDNRKDITNAFSLRKSLAGAIPMGQSLKEKYREEIFSIAFTAFEGQWGSKNDPSFLFTISTPPENSIEQYLKDSDEHFNFLASSKIPDDIRYGRPFGYLSISAPWDQIFDGYVYVEKMYPVTVLKDTIVVESILSQRLQGKIVDQETGDPLPYASVFIKNTANGTVSNFNGNFQLPIPPQHKNDSVYVTFIGYEPAIFLIDATTFPEVISLNPSATLLGEVKISSSLTAKQIIKRASENLVYNYIQSPYSSEIFFRDKRSINDSSFYLEEAALYFYDATGNKRASKNSIGESKVYQVFQLRRSLSRGKNKSIGLSNVQSFSIFDPVLSDHNVTGKRRLKKYEIELIGTKLYGDQTVFEISFKCENPTIFSTGFGYPSPSSYTGSLYIDTATFAIVRYKAMAEWDQKFIKKLKYLKRFKINKPSFFSHRMDVVYDYKKVNDKYFLHYSRKVDYFDFLVGNAKKEVHQEYSNEILNNNIEIDKPVYLKENKLHVNSKDVPYDKEFWDKFIFVKEKNN